MTDKIIREIEGILFDWILAEKPISNIAITRQILSIKGIRIEAENQELPKIAPIAEGGAIETITKKAQQDMLKEGEQRGIRRVVEFANPLLKKIEGFVSDIEGDWTDPRYECGKIYDLITDWQAFLKEITKPVKEA